MMLKCYVVQYNSEIKAVYGNLLCAYRHIVAELALIKEDKILSYAQIARIINKQNYYKFYTESAMPYVVSRHKLLKNFGKE